MMYIPFDQRYKEIAAPALRERFGYTNAHAIPRIDRIVINTGVGRLVGQKTGAGVRTEEAIKDIQEALARITGQKAVVITSRKSIAGFKLRAGMVTGLKVTLRGVRMKDFFDRFIYIGLPRTRDFRGISRTSVDGKGSITIGVKESIIFPELSDMNTQFGLEAVIVTTAHSAEEGLVLLEVLGVPFQKEGI